MEIRRVYELTSASLAKPAYFARHKTAKAAGEKLSPHFKVEEVSLIVYDNLKQFEEKLPMLIRGAHG